LKQLELDRVLWVPAGQPPHKSHQTAARHRVAMTQLSIADSKQFELCRLDVDRKGPHYTADLLTLLHDRYQARFWFIVGEDSLHDLPAWYRPERILRLARLAVYPRINGHSMEWDAIESRCPQVRERIDWLTGQYVDISSTEIRQKLVDNRPVADYLAPAVSKYIKENQLYRPDLPLP
jgi:nicotinate-nucleotide adenylyltransferase